MPTIVRCPICDKKLIEVRTVDGCFFHKNCRNVIAVRIERIREVPKTSRDARQPQGIAG